MKLIKQFKNIMPSFHFYFCYKTLLIDMWDIVLQLALDESLLWRHFSHRVQRCIRQFSVL